MPRRQVFHQRRGLLTLVIGAVIGFLPGASPLSIKAPSVALILILLSAISQLSPYPSTGLRYLLATLVLAGVLQVFSALLRLHLFYRLIPDVVVYGLITGLSGQVFLQQCFGLVAMPVPSQAWWYWFPDLLLSFVYADGQSFALGAGLVLFLFLPVLLGQQFPQNLPGIFWVFLIGLGLGIYLMQNETGLPTVAYAPEGGIYWLFPDFSVVFSWLSWEYACLIALLGTLESQINTQAVEVLDPQRRKSRPNLEIFGQGLGNIVAGCLGALPLSTSIEVSLANINQQAQSPWAARFQALLGLALFLTASWWLPYLPTLVLSAILLYVLYRLNSPQLYQSLREIGPDQWFIFLASLGLTLLFGPWAGLGGGFLLAFGVFVFLGCPWGALLYAPLEINQKGKGKRGFFYEGPL
ncbi:MAG: SulP family inorganic anion transporter [Microscillaceae bacterium]|nr:SulP family inorganic anion transporter [Microscillaceae bacterium]